MTLTKKMLLLTVMALAAALAACGDDDDDVALDGATIDAAAAGDARVDARVFDAGVDAQPCDQTACHASAADRRCNRFGVCTNSCTDDIVCGRGYSCDTGLCRCDALACQGKGEGKRCVENNVGAVSIPGPAVTACTNDCAVGWPQCPNNYMCVIGGGCQPMP